MSAGYVGRFAPSPTGPLHAGSLVAALASWLDARAAGGHWLVRIEDVDLPRCQSGAAERILAQLAACGLLPDEAPLYQSTRGARYQPALDQLVAAGLAYPCACTRRDIEAALTAQGLAHERHVERPYPGTCRQGLHGRPARAWRFNATDYQGKLSDHVHVAEAHPPSLSTEGRGRSVAPVFLPLPLGEGGGEGSRLDLKHVANQEKITPAIEGQASTASISIANDGVRWIDRRLGPQFQDVARQVGDFVLRRADGLWAYQLAVVVDDADQGVTHVVRGEDLADNTPRQILLQAALGVATPLYLHTPLVRAADGEKLSKQHGAPAIDETRPLQALAAAAHVLGLPPPLAGDGVAPALALWVRAWAGIYNPPL
ncbi:MAG: glutamyl-Q tRNA(Asp) synthetase [Proteobacteria bacterium]|nr:glutamyl-Q tRNA(Asp) synthetase [Pseudomonadota bacterium]MBS0495076.1 glutamyl-Q tRNA(Asp) synthetase [Pseudomonadota bacterium]